MDHRISQYLNEIISIFMMLMLCLAFLSSPGRGADDAGEAPVSVSVKKASKVATEPLRRPADGGRRFFD
jgi:hypothetical protein